MIADLIVVLVVLAIFGFLIWAVATYLSETLPKPVLGIIIVVIALIAVLICLGVIGVVNVGAI